LKTKLDENLGSRAIELFREAGHEVVTVSGQDLGDAPDDELASLRVGGLVYASVLLSTRDGSPTSSRAPVRGVTIPSR
jgi:hypothetical protein